MKQNILLMLVFTMLFLSAGCTPDGPGKPKLIPSILKFAKVSDVLYRGAQPNAEGFAKLKKLGIKTIVNLRAFKSDRKHLTGLGLKYYHISFKVHHPEDEDVAAFLKIVTNPANHPVFVHCKAGVDRTGMMVAIYRIVIQNRSKKDALDEMKNMGYHKIFYMIENYVEKLNVQHWQNITFLMMIKKQ